VIPVDALSLIQGCVHDLAGILIRAVPGLAAVLSALAAAPQGLAALAAAGIQGAAEGAAATGMAAGATTAAPEAVLSRLRFLTLAYTLVWVILAAYLVMLSLRQRRLARQIRRLRERLGA
jgi:CcmD family protein